MTQTGGCCRASNYVGFIRRALAKAGLGHIPVISINANGMETNEGFRFTLPMLIGAAQAIVFGDLLMRCLYRVRPYEIEAGSANRLAETWSQKIIDHLVNGTGRYGDLCQQLVDDFDHLPIHEDMREAACRHCGRNSGEVYAAREQPFGRAAGGRGSRGRRARPAGLHELLRLQRQVQARIFRQGLDKRGERGAGREGHSRPAATRTQGAGKVKRALNPPMHIEQIAELSDPFLSQGESVRRGVVPDGRNGGTAADGRAEHRVHPAVCVPAEPCGRQGVIKQLRKKYPQANICAVDFDPGASEVNQLNRIKLMLSAARKNMEQAAKEE